MHGMITSTVRSVAPIILATTLSCPFNLVARTGEIVLLIRIKWSG